MCRGWGGGSVYEHWLCQPGRAASLPRVRAGRGGWGARDTLRACDLGLGEVGFPCLPRSVTLGEGNGTPLGFGFLIPK